MRCVFLLLFMLIVFNSFSQKEANVWYFGESAGLDFSSGTPIPLTNAKCYNMEGCASVSDANGHLLFYTNGDTVWNKNHQVMSNGKGLMGSYSSSQSSIIIKKPGSGDIYYIFCTDKEGDSLGLTYSEVDMQLNGGLGNITALKNIKLYHPTCEKLTASYHTNGCDVWVITHKWDSNEFYVYRVTSSGVNNVPVISSVGNPHSGNKWNTRGYMKSSHKGDLLVTTTLFDGEVELFNFDRSTGIVYNPLAMNSKYPFWLYGVEFSPDDSKLYISTSNNNEIFQFDLAAGTPSAIASSAVSIDPKKYYIKTAMQLAPDGKIYVALNFQDSIGVINNPNAKGAACNYKDHIVSLAGRKALWGLPNILPGLFYSSYQAKPLMQFSDTCINTNVKLSLDDTTGVVSITWMINNGNMYYNMQPTVKFDTAGDYTVKAYIYYDCKTDSIIKKIKISTCIPNNMKVSLNAIPLSCYDDFSGKIVAEVTDGYEPYKYLWVPTGINNDTLTGLSAGKYILTVKDSVGNSVKDSVIITQPEKLKSVTVNDTVICLGDSLLLSVAVTGGTPGYVYDLGNGYSSQSYIKVSPAQNTTYQVVVKDSMDCADSSVVSILVEDCDTLSSCDSSLYIPSAFSPNNDGENDVFMVRGDCITEMELLIYNRWGQLIFHSVNIDAGWNGRHNNILSDPAVYHYVAKIVFDNAERIVLKGNLALVR